jgi:RNA polymerase sigma factor (TIGR02999 family)
MDAQKEMTQMLKDWNKGDQSALEKLMPIVYDELKRIAARYMRKERPGHTLQATALVNEAFLKLVDEQDLEWQNRAHFFAIAANTMRRVLVSYAIANRAEKRGGGELRLSLDEAMGLPEKRDYNLLSLNDALNRLAVMDERKSQIVELRFFAGLGNEEIAEALGISVGTVKREWKMAKAWLQCELEADKSE